MRKMFVKHNLFIRMVDEKSIITIIPTVSNQSTVRTKDFIKLNYCLVKAIIDVRLVQIETV